MNNKSDKKHKRKQKQKKPKTKKKTTKTTQSKKKNEIKSGGGMFSSFKGFFSKDNQSQSKNLLPQNPQPANSRNPPQNVVSQPPHPANPNNSQQNVLPVNSKNSQPPPPPPPNAQPQGFNTIKSTSRCSIL